MKAPETISLFRRQFADVPMAERQALLAFHAGLGVLAECADFAQLANGNRLRDGLDFPAWLRELEAACALAITKPVESVRVCMTCYHVHEKDGECGVDLGKGGTCECKAEVRA